VTVTSNGLRYVVESIDGVQMLHYMTILFPAASQADEDENPGLLPCRQAEIVLHTKAQIGLTDDSDITQLIAKCRCSYNIFEAVVWPDLCIQ
jgi:hypothetical protein